LAHHHHSHSHHPHEATGRVLKWSLAITAAFVVVELVFGFRAHSLALISDAGHNFTDALALALAAFAFYLQNKPADEVKTYGYHRAGVLAAFVNALTLVALAGFIFWESYQRLVRPEVVEETTMMIVAVLGLVVNTAIMFGLQHRKSDLNIRAAWVHMLGDALGSLAIIGGAITIRFTGWERIDPILSIVIGALIVWTAWDIIRESLNILLEGLPAGLDLHKVTSAMRSVDGVMDVHDLHIWTLGSDVHALSCHVLIADQPASSSESILKQLNNVLCGRFHIHHTTVQFEHSRCALSESGCSLDNGALTQ
jgi:cobalt-zinc-cadmium efflux system protein